MDLVDHFAVVLIIQLVMCKHTWILCLFSVYNNILDGFILNCFFGLSDGNRFHVYNWDIISH